METKGYDILAELDPQNDTFGIREYLLKRKQEAAEKAEKYLSENPKEFCYRAIGYPTDIPWDEEPEIDYCCLMRYTDQEVARIKELIVEMWNKYSGPEGQIQSYEELEPTADLRDLQDVNAELDQLLWDKAEESDFALRCIDFNQPLHAYLFSTYEYDKRKQEMCSHKHSPQSHTDRRGISVPPDRATQQPLLHIQPPAAVQTWISTEDLCCHSR